jgi:hypothetical protein
VTEPVPQPPPPRTTHEPQDPELQAELARTNMLFGLVLFGVFLFLFVGTIVVALIYLAVD